MLPNDNNQVLLAGNKPENTPQSLSTPFMESQEKVSSLTERIRVLEEENDALQDMKNQLQTNFLGLAQEAAEELLRATYPQLLDDISNLKQQVEEQQAENTRLINQIKQDRSNHQALAEESDRDSEALEGRIKQLEDRASQQHKQFETIQRSFEALSEEKVRVEQENQALKQNNQALVTKLAEATAEILAQKDRVEILSSQADTAIQDSPESKGLNENKWLKGREALIEDLLNLQEKLEQSESRYNGVVQTFEEWQAFYQELKEELKTTTDKHEKAVTQQSALEHALTEKNTQISSLEERLNAQDKLQQASRQGLEKEITEIKFQKEALKSQFKESQSNVEQFKTELKETQRQLMTARKQAFEITGDIEEFRKDVAQRDSEIVTLATEKAQLEGVITSLETENQGLQHQLQRAEKKQSDLKEQFEFMDRSLQEAREERVISEQRIEELAGKVGTLSKELAETEDKRLAQQEIFQTKEVDLQSKVSTLQDENNQLKSKVTDSLLQNKRLAEEADHHIDELNSEVQQQAKRIRIQENQLTQAQGTLQRAQEENSTLEQRLQSSESAQQGLATKLAEAKKTISEQNDHIEILRQPDQVTDKVKVTDKEDNNFKLQSLVNSLDEMALELNKVKEENNELKSKLSIAARETSDLNDELNAVREGQSAETRQVIGENPLSLDAELMLEESQRRVEQLNAQLKEAGEKQSTLEGEFAEKLTEAKKFIAELAERITTLGNEKGELEAQLKVAGGKQSEFKREIKEKDEQVAKLTEKKDQLESAHQLQIQRSQEDQKTIEDLTGQVVEVKKQRDEASSTLKVVEGDNQVLQQERDEKQENLHSAQAQLIKQDHELSSFRAGIQALEKKLKEKEALIHKQLEEKADSKIVMGNRDDLIAHLRGEIENLQQLVDTNKGEYANVQRQAIALKEQLKKSQGELQASRQDFAEKIAEIKVQKEAVEKKLTASESVLEQLNRKIEEADSDAVSNKGTIELLQKQKGKTEEERDTYKLEANRYQQKIEQLTEESKQALKEKTDQIAGLMKQSAQLTSDYQTQTQKSLGAQETIKRLTDQVAQLEQQQGEANRKLDVVEGDNQRLQQEKNKLSSELDMAMGKLKQAELDKQPAQTPLYPIQTNPERVQKRRHATDTVLAEGENLAQQPEGPSKIKRHLLARSLKKFGNDDESNTTEGRRSTMATGNEQTVIDESRTSGDNISILSGISQESTEDAASASLSRQNTDGSDDDSVFESAPEDNDNETPAVVSTSETKKTQKIEEILLSITPEAVANELYEKSKFGFLQELQKAKANELEESAALNTLPVLNEQVTALSNQHLDTYKALLANKLNDMPLNELESVNAVDELLAIESNSTTLKELARKQGETHAQNYLNRFQAVAIAKTHKVFEEAAQAVIANRQGTLNLAIDAKTLAERTIQNPATKLFASRLRDKVIETYKANPLEEQQARSQVNEIFVANEDAIKSAVEQTLTELEANEKDKQTKQVAIAQLFEKIDCNQVSKALINHARPILVNELTAKGYLLNRSIVEQLVQTLNQLPPSELEVVKKELAAILIKEKTVEQINVLGGRPEQVIKQLIHTQINQRSLAMLAEEMAMKLAQQEIDSYQNKTAQELENYYQSTHDFIKNAVIRLQLTMQNATSRELRDFAREDRTSLESIVTLINNKKFDEKKKELQAKLKEFGLSAEDKKSYEQAVKSIEGICGQKESILSHIGERGRLQVIETALNAIIAKNDQDSKQTIVKAESPSHFFKVIKTQKQEELASTREDFVNIISPKKSTNAYAASKDCEDTFTVTEFGTGSTLLEAIRVNTPRRLFKNVGEITLTYKAVKKDHTIEFSVDSVNADTRPSFIKKHIKNSDFVRSSTQSMLELAQGTGEGLENKGFGMLVLNTHDKNWKTRYALIKVHAALFPKQRMPLVFLEGKYTNASLISDKSLKSELQKLEDKFIKEYKAHAGSDEHINSFNTQVNLLTPASK